MRFKLLAIILVLFIFTQGYEYKYNVEPLDASNNAASRNSKGLMYMEMGQYRAALEEFKIAISLNPDSPASAAYYNNLGLLYMKTNKLKEAQECFNAAIKLNPVFLEYYKNLVKLYDHAGILDSALTDYLNEISKNNQNSHAYFMAGLICAQMGQNKDAIKYLKTFSKLEKDQVLSRAAHQMINTLRDKR